MPKALTFFSRNHLKLTGELYLPPGGGARGPAILLCQGLSGTKELVLPVLAAHFAAQGFVAMTFDYAGCGASEGEPGLIDLVGRGEDALAAFACLRAIPEVDEDRMGVYGLSLGGGIASWVALKERSVKAAVVVSGFGSGLRLLRSLRTAEAWLTFKARLRANRERVHLDGTGEIVDITEIFPFSEAFVGKYRALASGQDSSTVPRRPAGFRLSSAELMTQFDLVPRMHQISPCPILFVHGADDDVVPLEDLREVYDHAVEPKRLEVLDGYDHLGLDCGPGLERQRDLATAWFVQHLHAA